MAAVKSPPNAVEARLRQRYALFSHILPFRSRSGEHGVGHHISRLSYCHYAVSNETVCLSVRDDSKAKKPRRSLNSNVEGGGY